MIYQSKLDLEIISKVKHLDGEQKSEVLGYLDSFSRKRHSTRLHRRRAMRQIREALKNQ